jgi:hypothetical protein
MDDFLNTLRHIGKKPGFYLTPKNDGNSKSISHLRTFIVGVQVGQHLKHDTSVLDGFTEWVCHRYSVPMGARDWSGHILERVSGDEVAAFQLFFEHFEEYLQERDRIGADAIRERYIWEEEHRHNFVSDSKHPDIEKAEALLRPMMPDRFAVTYKSATPRSDGKLFRWFEVVFVVGPGEAGALRAQVHELFPRMLAALSPLPSVHEADRVILCARQFGSYFGIQANWTAAAVRQMRDSDDFSAWANACLTCRNDHDKNDAFNKRETRKNTTSPPE